MRKINTQDFTRATRSTPREINRQIALNLVREHEPISRADLARRMEVGRSLVTSLINELLDEGSVYEGETVDLPRGRKPKMLRVRTHDRLVVAIDVRFSRTYVMLSDFDGTQIALETFETIFEPDALVEELGRRVERLLRGHGALGTCEGVGMVVPGMVDQRTGTVIFSPQLDWRNVPVRDALSARTGLPVMVENASLACALAHSWLGQRGRSSDNFVYVTVSDGVGAGIVVGGELVRGRSNTAGEFGHVPLTPDGPQCLCGSRGCLEAFTSNLATVNRYLGNEISPAEARALPRQLTVSVNEVIGQARGGDGRAVWALEQTGSYLGMGLAMIINGLNPEKVVVGGEITAAWDLVEPHIRVRVRERTLTAEAGATPIIPEMMSAYPRLRGATTLIAAPMFAAPAVA
jgi:N-acetylglucosamine repressor